MANPVPLQPLRSPPVETSQLPPRYSPVTNTLPPLSPTHGTTVQDAACEENAQALSDYEAHLKTRRRFIINRSLGILSLATAIYGIILGYTLLSNGSHTTYLWGFGILLFIIYQLVILHLVRQLRLLKVEHTTFKESLETPQIPNSLYIAQIGASQALAPQASLIPPPPPCYSEAHMLPPAYTPKPVEYNPPTVPLATPPNHGTSPSPPER
ncbi:hypothetical protein IWQ61_001470 [Dispira simplex]|nr:hypothetical protein IWQ61_001470 [Dispira simplex]